MSKKQSVEYKKLLSVAIFIILILSFQVFTCHAERSISEIYFHKPFWSFLFNDIFPRAKFAFLIENKESVDITEGILVLQIAEDKGLATEPKSEEFKFLSYRLFDTIKSNSKMKLVFVLSEDYKPGRFRIKPSLFIYPKGKSPIKPIYEKMKTLGNEVFGAWEHLYFSEWDKNLSNVLGSRRREGSSYLIVVHNFYEFLGVTGLSFLGIIWFIWKFFVRIIGGGNKPSVESEGNEVRLEPKIYLKRAIKSRYSLGEIYNSGNEDITDFDVTMKYIDKSGREQTKKASFINESENPLFASYHTSSILREGERKYITDFPRVKVLVEVKGVGVKSSKTLKENIEIEKE